MGTNVDYVDHGYYGQVRVVSDGKYGIFTYDAVLQLYGIIKDIHKRETPRVIILTGGEDNFVTGFDINAFRDLSHRTLAKIIKGGVNLIASIEKSPKIFITLVNGYCLGGGLEIAMGTDYILASPDAKFGLPEIKLNIIPGFQGIQRMVRSIGFKRGTDMLLSGRYVSAKEAVKMGLITEVVPKKMLMRRAEEIAKSINSKYDYAVSSIKHLAQRCITDDVSHAEARAFLKCVKSEPAKQAINAFLDRHKDQRRR